MQLASRQYILILLFLFVARKKREKAGRRKDTWNREKN